MKMTLLALGTRGDVQPYIALGKGLRAAGYDVTIATHALFKPMVLEHGLKFYLVRVNPQDIMGSGSGQDMVESDNSLKSIGHLFKALKPVFLEMFDDCWDACQGTDVAIFPNVGLFPAVSIAEKLGIKVIGGYLQPVDPTGSFPCLLLTLRNLGGMLNRFTYWLFWTGTWLLMRPITNAWRKDKLGLPALPRSFLPGGWRKLRVPIMHGFSNYLVPKPKDWASYLAVTGYWFLDDPADWHPSPELGEFMDAGSTPVYVGFGSMKTRQPSTTARIVLKALERANKRAIFQGGWAGLHDVDFPTRVYKLDSVSHDWLFSRASALIHHGGGGTTGTGLRSGTPTITIPFYADQPFWGHRIAKIGAGPRPISRKNLTVDNLTAALQVATNDDGIKTRANQLGEGIRRENGVANAIEFIKHVIEA